MCSFYIAVFTTWLSSPTMLKRPRLSFQVHGLMYLPMPSFRSQMIMGKFCLECGGLCHGHFMKSEDLMNRGVHEAAPPPSFVTSSHKIVQQ